MQKLKFIAVGNFGSIMISSNIEELSKYNHLIIDTSSHDLEKSFISSKIQIGNELTNGLGTHGDPLLGEQAVWKIKADLEKFVADADLVFIIGGLGGGTATGAIPMIAQIVKNTGALTLSMVTYPFSFEGIQREKIAIAGIENLIKKSDSTFVIKNDFLILESDKKIDMKDFFSQLGKSFYQKVEIILNILKLPKLMSIDFSKFEAILKNGELCLVTSGKAFGANRAKQALENAFSSPYYYGNISNAHKMFINISSNGDLERDEVRNIGNLARSYSNNKIHELELGITQNDNLISEIEITIIGTNVNSQSNYSLIHSKKNNNTEEREVIQKKSKEKNNTEITIPKWLKG